MPTHAEWIVLAAGFFAAVMNAVAGGGTMLTFPALMAAGLSPVYANTTSTVALFVGMPGSVWAFRKRLAEVKSRPRMSRLKGRCTVSGVVMSTTDRTAACPCWAAP